MDNSKWIAQAKNKIGETSANTEFFLKDLFDGVEWNNLTVGERLGFGRFFKGEVLEGNVPNVQYIGKAQNNSARYKKGSR